MEVEGNRKYRSVSILFCLQTQNSVSFLLSVPQCAEKRAIEIRAETFHTSKKHIDVAYTKKNAER